MTIPKKLVPILENVTGSSGKGLEFWLYLTDMNLTEKFFELSSQLMIKQLDLASLPKGYELVALIYYWETNCQFSGWYAFANLSSYQEEIIQCYTEIGLLEESQAIKKAAEVWDEEIQNYDEVTNAYRSIPNSYFDENKRWSYLNEYFSTHAKALFYI